MPNRYGYVLTIQERYWNRFCRLNKAGKTTHAYVQGGAILSDDIKRIFFYSVYPFKEILGYADFIQRKTGNPKELWNSYGRETCLNSYDEYVKLTRGNEKVTIIRFKNFHEASNVVTFDQISTVLQIDRMPQIGLYVNKAKAYRLIELLK